MLGHWLHSGWRSLLANPLFSLITIISLSIGCAGALLAGSNIKQHLMYERMHPNADRILMVTRKQAPPTSANGQRFDGAAYRNAIQGVILPLKPAVAGKIPGVEAQTRAIFNNALMQMDQDDLDTRNAQLQQSQPQPGDPPPPPLNTTMYVDEDFFKVFPLEFVEGSASGLQEPYAIAITERRRKILFGDQPALGQTVKGVKDTSLKIVGVVKDMPVSTHLRFEVIAGIRTFQATAPGMMNSIIVVGGPQVQRSPMEDWMSSFSGFDYIKAAPGVDIDKLIPQARQVIQNAGDVGARASLPAGLPPGMQINMPRNTYDLVPLLDSHLAGPERIQFIGPYAATGDPKMVWTLAAGAVVLLVVSAFNYVTLSLARSLRRRREVAVRKVLGASQPSLITQYLVESGMVTAVSILIGFVIAWFLAPWFARAIGQPEVLFNLLDPQFLAMSMGVFVVLAMIVGAYPAFYLANVRPRTGLGEGGTASPGRVGQTVSASLLGLQIAGAAGLLIVSATMMAQAAFLSSRDLGYSIKNRYRVTVPCILQPDTPQEQMAAIMRRCNTGTMDVLAKTPGVTNAGFFAGPLLAENITTRPIARAARGDELGQVAQMNVDAQFLQTMGAKKVAGRFFDKNSAYDMALAERQKAMQASMTFGPPAPGAPNPMAALPPPPKVVPVIITESLMSLLGAETPEKALSQQFTFKQAQPGGTAITFGPGGMNASTSTMYEVVGVVADWHVRPLKYDKTPVMFIPNYAAQAVITIPEGQLKSTQAAMASTWRNITGDPKVNVNVISLEKSLEASYQKDFRLMYALVGFAMVAILVAGLGVYGLSAFEMRRRVREIGIRKALGASPAKVAGMVIGKALLFAGIATAIAWLPGFYYAQQWLAGFVYRSELSLVILPVVSIAVMGFVALAVSLNAARAAAVRPGLALHAT